MIQRNDTDAYMDVDTPFPSFESSFENPTSEALRLCPLWVCWGAQTWHLQDGYVDTLWYTIDLWYTDIEYAHIMQWKIESWILPRLHC